MEETKREHSQRRRHAVGKIAEKKTRHKSIERHGESKCKKSVFGNEKEERREGISMEKAV